MLTGMLSLHGSLNLLFYRIQDHLPGVPLPTVHRALPHQPLTNKYPTDMLVGQRDGNMLSTEVAGLFPGIPSLCQVDKKPIQHGYEVTPFAEGEADKQQTETANSAIPPYFQNEHSPNCAVEIGQCELKWRE